MDARDRKSGDAKAEPREQRAVARSDYPGGSRAKRPRANGAGRRTSAIGSRPRRRCKLDQRGATRATRANNRYLAAAKVSRCRKARQGSSPGWDEAAKRVRSSASEIEPGSAWKRGGGAKMAANSRMRWTDAHFSSSNSVGLGRAHEDDDPRSGA